MPTYEGAFNRIAGYYISFVSQNGGRADLVDPEFAQIQQVGMWLSTRGDAQFLKLLKNLAPYLQARSFYGLLLDYCQAGLQVADIQKSDPSWLWILAYEAHFALGDWRKAFDSIQEAIALSETNDPPTYARAILALGRLQINRGEYRSALRTLKTGEELSNSLSDLGGVVNAKMEVAAYFLVRGEFREALKRYLEVQALCRKLGPGGLANQSLLMLGVVYRKLESYPLALRYLNELLRTTKSRNDRGGMATAMHHLAWIHYDRRELAEARRLGLQAKSLYGEIKDPRGDSDADEQLGSIAFREHDYQTAIRYLEEALSARLRLGNLPGAASTLRRLAKLYFHRGRILAGMQCLFKSFLLYYRMNTMSRHRIGRIFTSPFSNDF